ncbi:DUF1816 domain-containing protein [Chroogloeocystis siderophila]|jgi:hypothetical protein|uniref:DUF1816 domain-containing protein n=1 Tax=Chroogloeocystis siderophila 5.2 s.c.1 TaxID=247279 RepID=A0A1U7HME1_9CHRO|nr:DUF1816 domain-containing protein [Chroogloeocystis siderophila]OKH24724.1 hypothetical protein NIES1031_15645 [Chroogloeocystis siderophila 5.2 s.c.1]
MKLLDDANSNHVELDWWVEVTTTQPNVIYYFGPFASRQEAQSFLPGYIEDIEQEGCQEICVQVLQCQPTELTVEEQILVASG